MVLEASSLLHRCRCSVPDFLGPRVRLDSPGLNRSFATDRPKEKEKETSEEILETAMVLSSDQTR